MSTTKTPLAAVATAALLVLAGCAGPVANGTDAPAFGAGPGDASTPADGTVIEGSAGTVAFYVSDEENAIGDFAHLNVTVTKVGLHRAGGDDGEDAADDDGESPDSNETAEPTRSNETETNATATAAATATATPTRTEDADEDDGADENEDETDGERETDDEREADDGGEEDGGEKDDGKAGWVEYEANRTVDLTELTGPNATKLETLAAPEGDYDKVFVYVDGIEATLESGEEVTVKLPSNKLQIEKGFSLGTGENVSFVFDISVHRAGNSGKYILEPVIGESGTSDEVEIEDVDEADGEREENEARGDDERDGGDRDETDDEERDDDDGETASDLTAEFQGPVEAGQDARVKVTGADGPVENATVEVNDETVGTTDASGTITFAVPADADEVEVEVTKDDAEAEVERELEDEGKDRPAVQALR